METQLNPPITNLSAKAIGEHYKNIRNQTETLCKPLKTEDYVVQPIVDVSPPKWHLGHTTWFFEYFVLKEFKKDYQEFNPDFPFVFNSYYESMGEKIFRAHRGNLSRPATEEVYQYRHFIDAQMYELLENLHDDEENQELLQLHRTWASITNSNTRNCWLRILNIFWAIIPCFLFTFRKISIQLENLHIPTDMPINTHTLKLRVACFR